MLIDNENGEPLLDTAQIGSFRISIGLRKFATIEQATADGMAESSQKSNERAENSSKCAENAAERAEKVKAWALNMISSGVRQDAWDDIGRQPSWLHGGRRWLGCRWKKLFATARRRIIAP